MSDQKSPARPAGAASPQPLCCQSCGERFGSPVDYCPFCGGPQQVAPVLKRVESPEPAKPPKPPDAPPWPPKTDIPVIEPPTPPEPPPVKPPVDGPKFPWKRALAAAIIVAAGIAYLLIHFNVFAPSKSALIVRVRLANGTELRAGHILVDDRDLGAPGKTLALPPGAARVTFQEPGYQPATRSVTIAKDAPTTIDLTTRELPGHLTLTTKPPGATARILNRNYQTPVDRLDLPPGTYDIAVTLNGYASKVVAVTLVRDQPSFVSVDLANIPAPPPPPPPLPRFQPPPFDRGVVTAPTSLLAGPNALAEVLATLPAPSELQVLAQMTTDETWLQVRANGKQGFVRAAGPLEAWDGWARRNTASGQIIGVTPNLQVVISGTAHPLFGIQLPDRDFSVTGLGRVSATLSASLRGAAATCAPQDTVRFRCENDGRDIAELYVLNGGAVAAGLAPPEYVEAQRRARERKRGLWSE